MLRHALSPVRAFMPSAALVVGFTLAPLAGAQDERSVQVFKDGQAQIVEGFNDPEMWIHEQLWVETEFDSDDDGKLDRMHVDVTRPLQTDIEDLKVPVIYETSPYYAGTGTTVPEYMWNPRQEVGDFPPFRENAPEIAFRGPHETISTSHERDWVPRGFAVIHSESPGTGMSDGCPSAGGKNEALAPKAVVDWLNGRAKGFATPDGNEEIECYWSTGKVGMTGTSYNGTLPIACATTGVDGLEAIIPVAPLTSYYHYYRQNGLIHHPGGYIGEDIDVIYDFIHSGPPEKREHCNEKYRDGLFMENFDRVNGDYNDFWLGRNYREQLGEYKAATLMAHAFNDWNVLPEHSVFVYEALKQKGIPVQAYFHQGGHGGPPPLEMMNRWFTRYVCGIENDVEKDPRSWVVREDANRLEPTPYADYPHPEAKLVELHPEGGGAGVGRLGTAASDDRGTESLTDNASISGDDLAAAEASDHRLLYVTEELREPLHISGTPTIKVRVASSKPATNLSIWIVSLPWKAGGSINDNIVTRGWADPQNHESLRHGEPLEPGTFYDVEFQLQPDDQVIPVGRRIGLMVFASDRDYTLWPEPGTELTVDLEHTSVSLPIVGGAAAVQSSIGASGE